MCEIELVSCKLLRNLPNYMKNRVLGVELSLVGTILNETWSGACFSKPKL